MRITNIEAFVVKLPAIQDDVDGTQDDLIVRVDTDEGITGWGEVDSSPAVAKAAIDTSPSHGISRGLKELLVGRDPLLIDQLWNTMYQKTRYHGRFGPVLHAMSGIDMALWDIAGKVRGEPVHRLLGGCYRTRVKAYASALMPASPAEARERAETFRRMGFGAMKFGWGPIGESFRKDEELFLAVREGAGPDAEIMIDAGQTYDFKRALRIARVLERIGASWLEEPLDADDLQGYARLSAASPVPIAAGEAESGPAAFRRLIEQGRIDIVQPDLSRAGGFTAARQIAQTAHAHRCRCIPHSFKSNVLLAASLHFCASTETADLLEFPMTDSAIRHQLTLGNLPMRDGFVEVPQRPGLGIEVDPEFLRMFSDEGSYAANR